MFADKQRKGGEVGHCEHRSSVHRDDFSDLTFRRSPRRTLVLGHAWVFSCVRGLRQLRPDCGLHLNAFLSRRALLCELLLQPVWRIVGFSSTSLLISKARTSSLRGF